MATQEATAGQILMSVKVNFSLAKMARAIIRDVLEEYAPHSDPAQKDMVTEALLVRLAGLLKGPAIPVIDQDKLAEALGG